MAYAMNRRPGSSNGSKLPYWPRVYLTIMYNDIMAPDALDLIVAAKSAVGDVLRGAPRQVISRMQATIMEALEREEPETVNIMTTAGIDLALNWSQQDHAAIEANIRAALATLNKNPSQTPPPQIQVPRPQTPQVP